MAGGTGTTGDEQQQCQLASNDAALDWDTCGNFVIGRAAAMLLLSLLLLLPPLSCRGLEGQQESSTCCLISGWLDQQDFPRPRAPLQQHSVSWGRQVWRGLAMTSV